MGMLLISFALLEVGSVVTHEHLHQTIFESYHIPSRVEYYWNTLYDPRKWFDGDAALGRTFPEKNCPTELCEIQHNFVECEEYFIQVLIFFYFISVAIFLMYKCFKDTEEEIDYYEKILEEYENQKQIESEN